MNACVECVVDGHCAGRADGRTRCVGANNTCAQCTAVDRTACMPTGRGGACLAAGLCGCTVDSDCSADRRCDLAMSACVMRAVPDAGVDAGRADAGRADAGTDARMDAGSDASLSLTGDGACSCRVVGGTTPKRLPLAPLAMVAFAAVVVARRRRRS